MPVIDEALLEATLDEFLDVDVPTEAPPEGGWPDPEAAPVVAAPDKEYVDRMLGKGRRLAAEKRSVKAIATRRISEIQSWAADLTGGIDREYDRLSASVEMFARNWARSNPKAPKTTKLANGTLKLLAARGRVVVTDEFAFVAWAKENRVDLLRYEPKPSLTALADEMVVTRHAGPQQNVEALDGKLSETWRLMATVDVVDETTGESTPEQVSIPGVIFAKPVEDVFSIKLPDDAKTAESAEVGQ